MLSLIIPSFLTGQIVIDQAGDDWRSFVDSSLRIIEKNDPEKRSLLDSVCEKITFWNGDFSSCEGEKDKKGTITIAAGDIKMGNLNVSVALVHESLHLYFMKRGIEMNIDQEEIFCYRYEIDFLRKFEEVDRFLLIHAMDQIEKRMEMIETKPKK